MTAGLEIYDSSGNVVLTNNSKILKVDVTRTTKSVPNGVWPDYYYSGEEESNKTVLVRPQVIGEDMVASTPYANSAPYAEIQSYVADTYSATNKVEIAVCSVTDTVTSSAKYLVVYDNTGKVSFDLNTFIKGARVVYYAVEASVPNNTWQTINLPSAVNLNNMFMLLPYSHIFNADNGTAPIYSGNQIRFRFTADKKFQYKMEGWSNTGNTFNVINLPIILLEVVR